MVIISRKDMRLSIWQNFACETFAGIMSKTLTSPLDVIKSRRQLGHPDAVLSYHKAFASLKRKEGFRALWKGNVIACVKMTPFAILQTLTFNRMRIMLADSTGRLSIGTALICGASSGILATLFTYPFEVMKTRFIAQEGNSVYKSMVGCAYSIYKREGLRTHYRGILPTVLGNLPLLAAAFVTYECIDRVHFSNHHSQMAHYMTNCLVAAVSHTAAYPFYTIGKLMRAVGYGQSPVAKYTDVTSSGMIGITKDMIKKHGVRGLWRGNLIEVTKILPFTVLTIFVYELSKRRMLYLNGYTLSPVEDEHLPDIDQALQAHELHDFVEERAAYQEDDYLFSIESDDCDFR